MKHLLLSFIAVFVTTYTFSQSKKEQDKKAIKQMCGCFEVGFNFIETFQYIDDTTYVPSKEKHAGALEYAELVEDEDGKIVIQHLLIVGDSTRKMIIKHWRQDWLYENQEFYMFDGDNHWNYQTKKPAEVKGQWTQKVYQVDDSPRYEGSSTWVHVDGKSYWENETDAPLPRREYTQRSDYNVTVRRNRHEITNEGWIHEQDNDKVLRESKKDELIAQEKGYNTYKRVSESKCQFAKDWWIQNGAFWSDAREAWDDVYAQNKNLELADKVEGKHLYEVLFGMDIEKTKKKQVKKAVKSFVQ